MESYKFRNTLIELYNIAGKTNLTCLFLAILLTLACILREIDLALAADQNAPFISFYRDFSPAIWFFTYCCYLYALAVPLLRIRKIPYGKSLSKTGWIALVIAFIFIFIASVLRLKYETADTQTLQLISVVIAVLVAVTGWFVQHQISANTSRVNHTLNILLETRISEVFETHTQNVNRAYPNKTFSVIPAEDVTLWEQSGIEQNPQIPADDIVSAERKALINAAITSQCYLLNYYEFLAVGIDSALLDEELLYQTLGGIIIRQVDRSKNLIVYTREKSPKTFINLANLERRWRPRRDFENKLCKNEG